MPKFACRTDGNHKAIVKALRQVGCRVLSLARVGGGCPDLLVQLRRVTLLLEVKNPAGENLISKAQADFHSQWEVLVVRSAEEAVREVVKRAA